MSKALNQNTTVIRLDIDDNSIGNDGLKFITDSMKKNKKIEDLHLGCLWKIFILIISF